MKRRKGGTTMKRALSVLALSMMCACGGVETEEEAARAVLIDRQATYLRALAEADRQWERLPAEEREELAAQLKQKMLGGAQ
jgi:hypothetical protein